VIAPGPAPAGATPPRIASIATTAPTALRDPAVLFMPAA
jgi:hypothetical protein